MTDTDEQLTSQLRDLAEAAAAAAAALLLDGRDEPLAVDVKSSPTDVVTEMDRASERLLVDRILAARPDDAILGEEGGERAGRTGIRWVLDPLDGTVNYLYGIPAWAVSVGVEVGGVPTIGVVDAPALGERFVAVLGHGAWLREADGPARHLHVSDEHRLGAALVATGFGYTETRRTGQSRVVAALLPKVRDVRRTGAASVDLCWVAAGRYDAFYERGLQPWDLAAGSLVAREAGAIVAGLRGCSAGPELVVAAGPRLFGTLAAELAALGADRD